MKHYLKIILSILVIMASTLANANVFAYDEEPIIGRMQVGETYTISCVSAGCYHYYDIGPIIITRKEDGHYISLNDKSVKLADADILFINEFDNKVHKLPVDTGSISANYVDFYIITFNKKVYRYTEAYSDWHGAYNLVKHFWPDEKFENRIDEMMK